MQASINERHLKDFVRLLQCASKYGDELCICANKDQWEFAVTNSSKSAFCLFKLQPRFFSRYQALGSPSVQRKGVKCSLLVKSVVAVLGKASAASSIERLDLRIHDPEGSLRSRKRSTSQSNGTNGTADSSSIGVAGDHEYQAEPDTRGSYLMVRLVCKHSVTKTHVLHLGATDFLRAEVDPDSTPSSFTISARTLRNWLDHFSLTSSSVSSSANPLKSENQLGWMFGKNEVRLKSWEGANKDLCTEIKVDVAEFGADSDGRSRYWVEQERVDLTLPMKEFRATLQLADSLNIDLTVAFSESTQPLTMVYTGGEEDDFDIFCAIATTTCDAFPVDLGKNGPGPPNNGLDSKPRRMISDLTEDGYPKRDGPDDAEGSVKRRRSSETPRSRRGTIQLSMTPKERAASAQPLVVLNSAPPSRNGDSGPAHSPQHPNNAADDTEETALFLAGGSQEDQSDIPRPEHPPASSQRMMTQAEVLESLGMGPGETVEDLMDDLEDNEDPEFSATQHVPQQDIADVADWSDRDLLGHQSGFPPRGPGATGVPDEDEFAAANSIFGDGSFDFPVQNLTPAAGPSHSPIRPPRTPGRINRDFQASPAPSLRSRPPEGGIGSRIQPRTPGMGSGSGSASAKSQQARVRTETQELRDMEEFNDEDEENGPTPGKKGMGKFSSFFGD